METFDKNNIEYIERYLNNELPDQEKLTFEAKIESNKELREQVDWVRNLSDSLFSVKKEHLTEQVKSWMDEESPTDQSEKTATKQEQSNSFSRPIKIAAALAAVLALLFLVWFFFLKQDETPVQKANQYIALYHSDPVILRGNQSEEWQRAIQLYKERDFDNMIESMMPIINQPNVSPEQLFYTGLAHLYNAPPALDSTLYYFSLNIKKDSVSYKEDIDWYSSLIHLKQGKPEKARPLLNSIKRSNSKYKNSASTLLKGLPK